MSAKVGTIPDRIQNYIVQEVLGEGVFGQVFRCFNPKTCEEVALKVLKDEGQSDLDSEVELLRTVGQFDPSKHNIVKFIDFFRWEGYNCMAFEMLDCSLMDFISKRKTRVCLSEIRGITQQLLVAFKRLRELEIVHTDLKLDNVMLVNQKEYPFRVRLIDFGLAEHKSELEVGRFIQPHCLKSPEVNLGLPLTEAVDMWSLGCNLLWLYLGYIPFSGTSPYDNQSTIVKLLGYPPDDLLNRGIYSRYYYSQERNGQWRLKSPEEYFSATGKDPKVTKTQYDHYEDLQDVILFSTTAANRCEMRDRIGFLNLVKKLLDFDYEKRITPNEALLHPFITLQYFDDDDHEYANRARDLKEKLSNSNEDVKEMSITTNQSSPVCASRTWKFTQVDEDTQILIFDDSNNKDISVKKENMEESTNTAYKPVSATRKYTFTEVDEGTQILTFDESKQENIVESANTVYRPVSATRKYNVTQVDEGTQILTFDDSSDKNISVKQENMEESANAAYKPVSATRKYKFTEVDEVTQILTFDDSINDEDISDKQENIEKSSNAAYKPVSATRKYKFTEVDEGTQILTFDDSINEKDISVKQENIEESANAAYKPVSATRKCKFTEIDEGTQILTFDDSINDENISDKQENIEKSSNAVYNLTQVDEGTQILTSKDSINYKDTLEDSRNTKFSANSVYRPRMITAEHPKELKTEEDLCLDNHFKLSNNNPGHVVVDMGDFRNVTNQGFSQRGLDFTIAEGNTDATTFTGNSDYVVIEMGDDLEEIADTSIYGHVKNYLFGLWDSAVGLFQWVW